MAGRRHYKLLLLHLSLFDNTATILIIDCLCRHGILISLAFCEHGIHRGCASRTLGFGLAEELVILTIVLLIMALTYGFVVIRDILLARRAIHLLVIMWIVLILSCGILANFWETIAHPILTLIDLQDRRLIIRFANQLLLLLLLDRYWLLLLLLLLLLCRCSHKIILQ